MVSWSNERLRITSGGNVMGNDPTVVRIKVAVHMNVNEVVGCGVIGRILNNRQT